MQRAQGATVICLMVMQPKPGPERGRGLLTPGRRRLLLWQLPRLLSKALGVLAEAPTIITRRVGPTPPMILKVAEVVGGGGISEPRRRNSTIGRAVFLIAQI